MFNLTKRIVAGMGVLGSLASLSVAQVQPIEVSGSQLGYEALKVVAPGEHVRIEGLGIPDGTVDLELRRITVLTPDAQLWVGTQDGIVPMDRPDVVLLSGTIAGNPDSLAYMAVSPFGTNGFVEINSELVSISSGPYAQGKNLLESLEAAWMSDVVDPADGPEPCGYTPGDTALEPSGPMFEYVPDASRGTGTCRVAGIAIETDWEFTNRMFGGNTEASSAYAITLIGAISEIYQRDMNVRLSIPFLRVWGDDSDPYSPDDGDPLDLVRAEWNANMTHVDRTVVHYLTGRQDVWYGGIAYLSVLCNSGFGYGVSAHLAGSFPYPLVDHNGGNWDIVVVSHELGHNFGTGHTHNYDPPIDNCGNGDCADAFGGTIMSYCHTCSGGLTNIVLGFHPRVQDVIIGFMDSIEGSCSLQGQGVSAVDDSVEALENQSVQIDALGNDESESCDAFSLDSFDTVSAQGGSVELLAGQGPGGRDLFLYTPPTDFDGVDTFGYSIVGAGASASATVSVDVLALRPADNRLNPIDGLRVKYYELVNPSVLPDFDTLIPYDQDVSTAVDYPSTGGNFMTSGRANEVGALFSGYVLAIDDGMYTFTTESDDGSKLFIGDELVVNNDGLHGMVKRSGTIPLATGWHQVRIEFFENGGGAGLIATIEGPGFEEIALEGLILSHEASEQCSPADINADGTLNFFDISAFLEAFAAQAPAADFDENGTWNFFDISAFLATFSEGCP